MCKCHGVEVKFNVRGSQNISLSLFTAITKPRLTENTTIGYNDYIKY